MTSTLDNATTNETASVERTPISGTIENRELNLDQVFEVLKNERRRYVLEYLREFQGEVSLSDLSEQIAAWENDKEIHQITSSERKRVYVGLYQSHLPKMDGMDVISFNKSRGIITPGENIDVCYPYLDATRSRQTSGWLQYYAGVSVAAVLLLVGGLLIEFMTAVPAVEVAATGAVVGFVALTAFVYMRHRSED